ncbi:hypothetical protein [Clostridium sp. UBA7791]|uniref:hypothetical protein n=1 Tax=Clostridium sp. UBA7791 TaxID=1946379 RepID=UPI003216706A
MKKNNIIALLERALPIIISLAGSLMALATGFRIDLLHDYNKLFSNTISFSSIFIGMLMTLVGLILGFASKYVIKRIKSKNADKILITYFKKPIFAGIILVVVCLVLSNLFDENILTNITILKIISTLWIMVLIYFLTATIRVLFLTFIILKEVFHEDTEGIDIKNEEGERKKIEFDDDCF